MATPVSEQFGKRRLPPLEPAAPVKRSGHVALLVMGTLAVGGGAYALAPRQTCDPGRTAITSAATPGQIDTRCTSRSWFSGGGHGYYGGSSSRSGFYSGGSSSSAAGIASPGGAAGNVTRGGFGSFAHAISAHFSGGG